MNMSEVIASDSAVRLDFLQAGDFSCYPTGNLSQKTAPYTIICQATMGSYKLTSGGRTVTTNPPEAWITPANQELQAWHYGDNEHGGEMRVQYVHCHFVVYETIALTDLLDMPAKTSAAIGQKLMEPMSELVQLEPMPRTIQCVTRRQSLVWQILETIVNISCIKQDSPNRLKAIQRLRPLLTYLHKNLSEPVTIDDMASLVHLSPSRFHAVFRQSMNATPLDYLKKIRLDAAARMLLASDASVAEISRAVGFKNQFHLSREFHNQFGLSPLKYRKSIPESASREWERAGDSTSKPSKA